LETTHQKPSDVIKYNVKRVFELGHLKNAIDAHIKSGQNTKPKNLRIDAGTKAGINSVHIGIDIGANIIAPIISLKLGVMLDINMSPITPVAIPTLTITM
jgi:hypothetical protein